MITAPLKDITIPLNRSWNLAFIEYCLMTGTSLIRAGVLAGVMENKMSRYYTMRMPLPVSVVNKLVYNEPEAKAVFDRVNADAHYYHKLLEVYDDAHLFICWHLASTKSRRATLRSRYSSALVANLLAEKDVTIQAISDELKFSKGTLYKSLRGLQPLSPLLVTEIANHFGVDRKTLEPTQLQLDIMEEMLEDKKGNFYSLAALGRIVKLKYSYQGPSESGLNGRVKIPHKLFSLN